MRVLDGPARLFAVAFRNRIGLRELDKFVAGQRDVQPTKNHEGADGAFRFAQGHKLGAKIMKSELGLSNAPRSPIVLANLLRTDRCLPRLWQRDVTKREQSLENLLSKLKNRLDRLAE